MLKLESATFLPTSNGFLKLYLESEWQDSLYRTSKGVRGDDTAVFPALFFTSLPKKKKLRERTECMLHCNLGQTCLWFLVCQYKYFIYSRVMHFSLSSVNDVLFKYGIGLSSFLSFSIRQRTCFSSKPNRLAAVGERIGIELPAFLFYLC